MKFNVISAFPGTSRNSISQINSKLNESNTKFDLTSISDGYINYIKDIVARNETILVSSHKVVRDALVENGIEFILAYPSIDQKQEYIKRYRDRGSPEAFIALVNTQWENWINECDAYPGAKVKLTKGYLSDIFSDLID